MGKALAPISDSVVSLDFVGPSFLLPPGKGTVCLLRDSKHGLRRPFDRLRMSGMGAWSRIIKKRRGTALPCPYVLGFHSW